MVAPVTEIFCDLDDFCKDYFKSQSSYLLPNPDRIRDKTIKMSLSEIAIKDPAVKIVLKVQNPLK